MTTKAVIVLILLILAFVLIALRGCGVGHPRFDFGWIGVAILVLVYLLEVVVTA